MTCHWRVTSPGLGLNVRTVVAFASSESGVLTRPPGRSRQPGRTRGRNPVLPLVFGPADRRKGLSRENEQANTHNELAEYPASTVRVKTRPDALVRALVVIRPRPSGHRLRSTRRSSQTGSVDSRTTPSE